MDGYHFRESRILGVGRRCEACGFCYSTRLTKNAMKMRRLAGDVAADQYSFLVSTTPPVVAPRWSDTDLPCKAVHVPMCPRVRD